MENQTAENTESVEAAASMIATQAAKQKKSRFALVRPAPKWLMLGVPVLAVALVAYGYNTGYLKQAGNKASSVIASFAPAVAKKVGIQDKLTVAREAFATGDMNAAIKGYRAFIASNPADMAAHGELGNVLYTVGALPEAAQAYFEAASMAIEQNHPEIAEALLPSVIEGNPMLADQLSGKLFDAQMRADLSRPVEGGSQQQSQQQG